MPKILIFVFIALLHPLHSAKMIAVPNTSENWQRMQTLGLDYAARTPDSIHLLIGSIQRLKLVRHPNEAQDLLEGSHTVLEDANAQFEALPERSAENPLGIYHSFAELSASLKKLVADHPEIATLKTFGHTAQNRPIYGVVLAKEPENSDLPSYFVVGSHHAREWISAEVPLAFLRMCLQNYAQDAAIQKLVDQSRIVVVPMLNVDGSVYSRQNKPMWRKNRVRNASGGVGVDNNRNYSYKWGVTGASSWPGSNTYKGPHAMSEKENQTVRNLVEEYNFLAAISFHSYGELVLWPWSYTDQIATRDDALFRKHGQAMAEMMDYQPIQSAELYPSAGDTDDFLYGEYGVLSFTIELGTRFVPSESEYREIVQKGPRMIQYLFENHREALDSSPSAHQTLKAGLESLVFQLTLKPGASLSELQLAPELLQADVSQIQAAMQGLNMQEKLQQHIHQRIRRAKRFQALNQK